MEKVDANLRQAFRRGSQRDVLADRTYDEGRGREEMGPRRHRSAETSRSGLGWGRAAALSVQSGILSPSANLTTGAGGLW